MAESDDQDSNPQRAAPVLDDGAGTKGAVDEDNEKKIGALSNPEMEEHPLVGKRTNAIFALFAVWGLGVVGFLLAGYLKIGIAIALLGTAGSVWIFWGDIKRLRFRLPLVLSDGESIAHLSLELWIALAFIAVEISALGYVAKQVSWPTTKEGQTSVASGTLAPTFLVADRATPTLSAIAIFPDFETTYVRRGLSTKLGKPLAAAYEVTTFQSSHINKTGNATMVMFTEDPPMLCRLYDDRSARCESDPDWKRDVKHYDVTTLRAIFTNVPKGKFPPYGGVASRWLDEKKRRDWSAIGWSGWQCSNDHAHLQEFEHGRMIGLFRNVPKENNEGQIFVILDGVQDWVRWIPDIDKTLQAPACEDPLANWK